jgi:aminopeptidase
MPDPRVQKLAEVLVRYSLELKPGEEFILESSPIAQDLNLAIYQEAVLAGSHVIAVNDLPGAEEILYHYATDEQLDYVSPVYKLIADYYTANLYIEVLENTRELTSIDPARISRVRSAMAELRRRHIERTAAGEARWCMTVYPTHAAAQEAEMSLAEYQDFVYGAGLLDQEDPVAAWKRLGERHRELVAWLEGKDQVVIRGSDIDVRFSIRGRPWVECSFFNDTATTEIYTSPIEDSLEGWVRFSYPAIFQGREVDGIEITFQDGEAVKQRAAKGQDLLRTMLATDPGAPFVGEWGIGTNYGIQRFTKNMLFDEKMGGTIHFAFGFGFPESGGQNQSGIHWDILCDMQDGEILIDDELFYKNGEFQVS